MSEYDNTEANQLMDAYNKELETANLRSTELHKAVTMNNQQHFHEQNLIEWQLDLSKELELIGHQLRGQVVERDVEGNESWGEPKKTILAKVLIDTKGVKYWVDNELAFVARIENPREEEDILLPQDNGTQLLQQIQKPEYGIKFLAWKTYEVVDEERKLLNERGAQEIEKIIRNYLNRNTLLSNYDIKTINQRMYQFSERLRRFIFLNYEEFGLTTDYKMKHFEMLVMNIADMVESAYLRALGGGERESLRTARQVFQTETPGKQMPYPGMGVGAPQQQQKKWYKFW